MTEKRLVAGVWREKRVKRFFVILTCAFGLLSPTGLSAQDVGDEGQTKARRGMAIGAAVGGALGGLALGVVARGLCEFDCDRAFEEGLVVGFLGGGVFGGLTGLVVGAGIPSVPVAEGADEAAPWGLSITLGPRWAGPSTMRGVGSAVTLRSFRPTTSRVQWGFEGAFLGGGSSSRTILGTGRDGTPFTVSTKVREKLWSVSVMAARTVGTDGRGYLMASAGAYPTFESTTSVRTPADADVVVPPRVSERSWGVFPGLSLGAGGLVPVSEALGLGGEGRIHLIPGGGDESILPVLSLSFSLSYQRGITR